MDYQIFIKGEDKTDRIKSWQQFGNRIQIIYSDGKSYMYGESNVKIIPSALLDENANQCFEYLKSVAAAVSLENEQVGNILKNQYNKMDFVSSESILANFLTAKLLQRPTTVSNVVFPFGYNESQKIAVEKALANDLSIIEGPPGTGKTQTILNIIANAVMRGESVAVVSGNNSATKNVQEKLEKYSVDFISAYLGSVENKKIFIDNQENKPLPNLKEWRLSHEKKKEIETNLQFLSAQLDEKLKQKNRLAKLRQFYDALMVEYKQFNKNYQADDSNLYDDFLQNKNADKISEIAMWVENYKFREKYDKWNTLKKWLERWKLYFKFGIINKTTFKDNAGIFISVCWNQFYIKSIKEITTEIDCVEKELKDFDFDGKMKKYSEFSMQLFHDQLASKYADRDRQVFTQNELWRDSNKFIEEYPVVLSTTYSLRSSLSQKTMYDYVIIDESSQVNLATGALALSCAQKAVIVGDLKQLPNVVTTEDKEKTDCIFAKFSLPEYYRYGNHSILQSITEMFPNSPKTLLREHYRCHPKIIEFCNQKFYDNQLIILSDSNSETPLMVYQTAAGNHDREHLNLREIDVITKEIIPNQQIDIQTDSLGIITPYRNQANELQRTFSKTKVEADTVHKFQGREKDIIVISTVDNQISDFTDNENLLNVAVSRAKDQLIIVVNGNGERKNTNIADLVNYIKYNNLEVIQSNISSIFDLLYKCNNEQRKKYLANKKIVSEWDSENLMYSEVENVLNEDRFKRFAVAIHYPMRMVLHGTDNLTDDEAAFALNELTHFDFLIYDKISKHPRLVIEVDGVAHHKKGSPQSRRDDLKNAILDKIEIPIIRFATNGSDEKKQLREMLETIIK